MGLYSRPARWRGGVMDGTPKILVVHSAETPLQTGYALAIANFFRTESAKTSAHEMVDPRDVVVMVPDDRIAYHCGNGNRHSKGYEQAGYARFSRAQWTTPDGVAQMRLLAGRLARDCKRYGIPVRWATDAQIRAAHAGGRPAGITNHATMSRVLGGSTHTDPGDHYPYDLLLGLVDVLVNPAPAQTEEDDMAQIDSISDEAAEKLGKAIAKAMHNQVLGAGPGTWGQSVQKQGAAADTYNAQEKQA